MSVFRRRRGHPLITVFNAAAGNYADDALTFAYYFDDAHTKRWVTND